MRILYFTRDYTTHDRRFLEKMAQSQHEIFFLRLEDDGIDYESRPMPEGIVDITWQGGKKPVRTPEDWLRLVPDLSRVLEEVCPDLVHAGPVQSCAFMTARAGFHPLLVMSWGSDMLIDAGRDGFWESMTKYTLERADFIFCDCNAVREAVCRMVPFADDLILQDCWGIDMKQFVPGPDRMGLKERLGWEDNLVVLTTRTWEPIYGPDIALKAFERAYSQNNRLRLIMTGSGSMKKVLDCHISKNNLDDLVHCPGHIRQDQLPDFYRAADLYLSCSYSDGTSISLMEAMATGLPVIVTDSPGNREWVSPEINGWLAAAGKPEDFGSLITQASALSQEKRYAISTMNRNTVERYADGDVTFARLMALYERIERQNKAHKAPDCNLPLKSADKERMA
jgi:L-malate glycosyltransferase